MRHRRLLSIQIEELSARGQVCVDDGVDHLLALTRNPRIPNGHPRRAVLRAGFAPPDHDTGHLEGDKPIRQHDPQPDLRVHRGRVVGQDEDAVGRHARPELGLQLAHGLEPDGDLHAFARYAHVAFRLFSNHRTSAARRSLMTFAVSV